MHDPNLNTIEACGEATSEAASCASLTALILWHPDTRRIGREAVLSFRFGDSPVDFSRITPVFDDHEPLADLHVSRSPLQVVRELGGGRVWPGRPGLGFEIDGEPGRGGDFVDMERMARGWTLGLHQGPILRLRLGTEGASIRDHGLFGASPAIRGLRLQIEQVGPRMRPTLILGESGTGKELVARALHDSGPRALGPYVAVNLAAIPASTAASQLFGHTRGAFTGADRSTTGFFGQAEGGTLFLDEVGACPSEIQPLLLRALEAREIQPVGGPIRRADVRVLTATDEDLAAAVRSGRFRSALYHRLAQDLIRIPPLRDRPEDIATLTVHFLGIAVREQGIVHITSALGRSTMAAFLAHSWPGNVRELRAAVLRLADRGMTGQDSEITLLEGITYPSPLRERAPAGDSASLLVLLDENDFNLGRVARKMGIGINTLRRRMEKMGIRRPRDLGRDEISEVLDARHSIREAARQLGVSEQGLKLRLAELRRELDT